MQHLNHDELGILTQLHRIAGETKTREVLDAIAGRVESNLAADSRALLAWEPVPLATYGELPRFIQSSWVFVLRARTTSGAERHPNSHQRVMSYRGAADLQTWIEDRWESNALTSDATAPLVKRWLSIPVDVWHKPVMGDANWVVVSFHTAEETELIEERGDPASGQRGRRKTYL